MIYSNKQQSKRLLELGLPIDSADLGRVSDIMHGGLEVLTIPYSLWCKGYENISEPVWSFGCLLDIINRTQDTTNVFNFRGVENYIDWAIRYIEQWKQDFDFSKLGIEYGKQAKNDLSQPHP